MNVNHFVQMKMITFSLACVDNDINLSQQENMHCLLKRKKYIIKYIVEQLSEHFGKKKKKAIIFMKVILVGKPTKLLKKLSVLCVQVCVGKMAFL